MYARSFGCRRRFNVCSTKPPHGMPKYASWCWTWFQQSVPTRSPFSRPSCRSATASCFARRIVSAYVVRWNDLSGSRETISPRPKYVSARRSRCVSVKGNSIIWPSTAASSGSDGNGDAAEHGVRDVAAQLGRARAERLEPERALVEPVQWMLPREAGAAVHLDRALARGDRGLDREGLRGSCGDGALLVVLGDAPRGPVGERAGELDVGVRVRELVRHRLIDADRLAELLARLRVLDAQLERALCNSERLGRHRRTQARRLLRPVAADPPERAPRVDGRERLAAVPAVREAVQLDDAVLPRNVGEVGTGVERIAGLLEEDRLLDEAEARLRDVEPAELRELRPAVVLRRVPVAVERIALGEPLACEAFQLDLVVGEGEVHQRDLGSPSTRSATMFRRTSDVPASIVLPRLRSCWWFHQPSSVIPSGPRSSRASFVRRWFASDQRSLTPEPSGPGTPVRWYVPSAR